MSLILFISLILPFCVIADGDVININFNRGMNSGDCPASVPAPPPTPPRDDDREKQPKFLASHVYSHGAIRRFQLSTGPAPQKFFFVGEKAHGMWYDPPEGNTANHWFPPRNHGLWWCSMTLSGSESMLAFAMYDNMDRYMPPWTVGTPFGNPRLYSMLKLYPLAKARAYASVDNRYDFPAGYVEIPIHSLDLFLFQKTDDILVFACTDDSVQAALNAAKAMNASLANRNLGEGMIVTDEMHQIFQAAGDTHAYDDERMNGIRIDIAFKGSVVIPEKDMAAMFSESDEESAAYDTHHAKSHFYEF
eukprot:TRINITY_DN8052_c0_g1_i1.p1 TRINITY_DN8052_c0_g1~~TRINITY_DN8052_c0_g1_i1.p1  ORF type:complete len:323 (+),score=66.37 TRINITY_DN8052_c0_g1_i1:57-971(+)